MGALKGANNIQAGDGNVNVTASMEFLSQCMLASNLLDISGAPIRNFSMLLNIFDTDNSSLDTTSAQGISRPYSNIEGARQLALGMNVLAHVIKRHPKTMVVMASEGGRGKNGGDNKVSHMFVMGSKATADMKDHLYTDPSIFTDPTHPFHNEPNAGNVSANNTPGLIKDGSGLAYYQQGELKSATSGQSIKNKHVTVSSVLNGVVRKMEGMSGIASDSSSVADLGDYVELKSK